MLSALDLFLYCSINTEHRTHLFTGLAASTASRKKPSCIQSSFEVLLLTLYPPVTCDSSLLLTLGPWMGVSPGQPSAVPVRTKEWWRRWEDELGRGLPGLFYSLPEDRSLQQNHLFAFGANNKMHQEERKCTWFYWVNVKEPRPLALPHHKMRRARFTTSHLHVTFLLGKIH